MADAPKQLIAVVGIELRSRRLHHTTMPLPHLACLACSQVTGNPRRGSLVKLAPLDFGPQTGAPVADTLRPGGYV